MFSKYKAAQSEDFEEHLNKYHVIQMDVNTFRHRRDKKTGETVTAMQTVGLIKSKKYVQSLKEYQGKLLLVGVNYDKVSKKHECVIEEMLTKPAL